MTTKTMDEMHDLALKVVQTHREAVPEIIQAYWFPDTDEIRMLEVEESEFESEPEIHPFYFPPAEDMPKRLAIALIRPDEVEKVKVPEDWGAWSDAVKLLED